MYKNQIRNELEALEVTIDKYIHDELNNVSCGSVRRIDALKSLIVDIRVLKEAI